MPTSPSNICQNFSAAPGTGVVFTNIPPNGCTVSQDGNVPWPFNVASPIMIPAPTTISIKAGLSAGKYGYVASCCPKPVTVTVT